MYFNTRAAGEIECERWRGIPVEEHVCELCGDKKVEDEIHFLCTCTVYDNMRVELCRRPLSTHGDFLLWKDQQKYLLFNENESHEVANL